MAAELGDFGIIEPDYIPAGVEFKDSHKLEGNKDHAVLIRYDGIYQYTIMESRPLDRAVALALNPERPWFYMGSSEWG